MWSWRTAEEDRGQHFSRKIVAMIPHAWPREHGNPCEIETAAPLHSTPLLSVDSVSWFQLLRWSGMNVWTTKPANKLIKLQASLEKRSAISIRYEHLKQSSGCTISINTTKSLKSKWPSWPNWVNTVLNLLNCYSRSTIWRINKQHVESCDQSSESVDRKNAQQSFSGTNSIIFHLLCTWWMLSTDSSFSDYKINCKIMNKFLRN